MGTLMEHLAAANVPVFATREEGRAIWDRCADRRQPVLAVRDGERGYVVHYDLGHVERELSSSAVRELRARVRSRRSYPTGVDPISETEGVGGEAGPVAGALHAHTEREARDLASHLSSFILDRRNWR